MLSMWVYMANNPNANSKRTENKYEQTTPIPKNKTIVLTVGLTIRQK